MSKVTKLGQTAPSEDSLGTVHVIVENTTFTKDMWNGKTYLGRKTGQIPMWKSQTRLHDDGLRGRSTEQVRLNATQKGAETNYISSITDN